VGATVGEGVGDNLFRTPVGSLRGKPEGLLVGSCVGEIVGEVVGRFVGATVGEGVGATVGISVGWRATRLLYPDLLVLLTEVSR